MTPDNAIVNVPLAKRGNINAQLDAYKRQLAAEKRAAAKVVAAARKANYAACLTILDAMSEERFAAIGRRNAMTAKQCRARIKSNAFSEPARYLAILQREKV